MTEEVGVGRLGRIGVRKVGIRGVGVGEVGVGVGGVERVITP